MSTNGLAVVSKQDERPFFSEEQEKIIRDALLGGASPSEAAVLMEVARARKLNPLLKQIHFVKRRNWDSETRAYKEVWSFQVGIDGFRTIAERTGQYDGQDEPEFEEGPGGIPRLCKVRVYRKGISRPFVGFAYWDEYVQTTKEGKPNSMWSRGKHFMLAKCAEAVALRKAFPEDLGGVYAPEELPEPAEKDATPIGAAAVRAALAAGPAKPSPLQEPKPEPSPKALPAPGEADGDLAASLMAAEEEWKKKPGSKVAKARLAYLQGEMKARRAHVVDVAPGETEEQAEARSREPGGDDAPPPGDADVPFGVAP